MCTNAYSYCQIRDESIEWSYALTFKLYNSYYAYPEKRSMRLIANFKITLSATHSVKIVYDYTSRQSGSHTHIYLVCFMFLTLTQLQFI